MKSTAAIVAFAVSASTAFVATAAPPSELEASVRDWRPDHSPRAFSYGFVHLRDIGPADAIVLIRDPYYCGSGGCVLIVLEGEADGSFKLISTSTISREPLYLLPQKSHGRHDFTALVGGGGARTCNVLMRFNGRRYPRDPSTAPCATQAELSDATLIKLDQ
jgi:putative lipoprotein